MRLSLHALLLTAVSATVMTANFAVFAADDKAHATSTSSAPTEKAADATKPADGKNYTILKIGNDEIKDTEVIDIWKGLFPGGSAPDFNTFDENIRQNVLRGIASERLIYSEALKSGYDKDPEVKKRIIAAEKQIIMQAFMENKAKTLVTDEQLRAAYAEKQAAAKGQEELKARHILVPTEDEAKKLSEQIKKGSDFDKLAKEKSTDKGSGAKGGELGWFSKDKMVPEFADAAAKLKKGEVSAPVKTSFGWHIIQLEDRRPLQIASFDDMKDVLRNEAAGKAVQSYVEGLLKTANVKYYTPDGKEKPFNTALTPAPADTAPSAGSAKPDASKDGKK